MVYRDVTVLIPTLNEGKNIGKLIAILTRSYPKINIIVADDGSSDDTQAIVKKWGKKNKAVKLLDRTKRQIHGLSASILEAIKKTNTEFFIVIDGDLQHPPEKIKEIAKKLRKCDVVIATRKEVATEWSLFRRLMSSTATNMALIRAAMTGTPCKDIMSGFFGAKTELFKQKYKQKPKSFVEESYKVLFDFLKTSKNIKVTYVPYVFGIRKGGQSKIGSKHIFYFLKSLLK